MQTVHLRGRPGLRQATRARDLLPDLPGRGDDAAADLADVDSIDSAGLASLVQAMSAARAHGRGFALRHLNDRVGRMRALSRLDRVLAVKAGSSGRKPI